MVSGSMTLTLIIFLKLLYLAIPFVYVSGAGITNSPEIYLIPLFFFILRFRTSRAQLYSFVIYTIVAFVGSIIVWAIFPLTLYLGSFFFDYVLVFFAPLLMYLTPRKLARKQSLFFVNFLIIGVFLLIFGSHCLSSLLFFKKVGLAGWHLILWAMLYNSSYVAIACVVTCLVMTILLLAQKKNSSFCIPICPNKSQKITNYSNNKIHS